MVLVTDEMNKLVLVFVANVANVEANVGKVVIAMCCYWVSESIRDRLLLT